MIRRLLTVAASALVLAILSLSAAWVIGGVAIAEHLAREDTITIGGGKDHGPDATRKLVFDPAVPLTINAPVELDFTRDAAVDMTVSGKANQLDLLEWRDGELSLRNGASWSNGGISVTITAPTLPKLVINGPGRVDVSGLDQKELSVDINGAGRLDVSGKVERVTARSAGAGKLDLSALNATDARIDISGVGDAEVNASGTVDATISGAGNISLLRKPQVLNSRITGIGSVDEDY